MSTKVKYYQENDTEAINADLAYYKKFGYKVSEKYKLDGRDAICITYTRKETAKTAKLSELEKRYDDAQNAIGFYEDYRHADPNKYAPKMIPIWQLIASLLLIAFFGLFLVSVGGIGVGMFFFPEPIEQMFADGTVNLTINMGDQEIKVENFNRDFSYAFPEEILPYTFGIDAISWNLIATVCLAVGVIMAAAIVIVFISLITTLISRIKRNKEEKQRYKVKLGICTDAADAAREAMREIDAQLAKKEDPEESADSESTEEKPAPKKRTTRKKKAEAEDTADAEKAGTESNAEKAEGAV